MFKVPAMPQVQNGLVLVGEAQGDANVPRPSMHRLVEEDVLLIHGCAVGGIEPGEQIDDTSFTDQRLARSDGSSARGGDHREVKRTAVLHGVEHAPSMVEAPLRQLSALLNGIHEPDLKTAFEERQAVQDA